MNSEKSVSISRASFDPWLFLHRRT